MKIYQTQDIRNIALVGGAKSGKTSMAEAMAFCGGLINRRGSVDSKNTISDYRDYASDYGATISDYGSRTAPKSRPGKRLNYKLFHDF